MYSRDRFLRVARRQRVDRIPYLEEVVRKEVLGRWHCEGLSPSVTEGNYRSFFGLDKYEYIYLGLEPKKGSLRSRKDYDRLEESYRSDLQDFRLPQYWQKKAEEYKERDFPLGIMGWRGFLQPLFTHRREWDSLKDVLLGFYDFPGRVKSALDLVTDCYVESIELAFQHIDLDFGVISEPIASRNGPVISPQMFAEFVLPSYRRVIDSFHNHAVDVVIFRSICNVKTILPLVVEAGVDGLWVGQTSGVVDYVELRKDYPDLLLIGGLDATVLAWDEDAIRAEVMAKVPRLMADGRYLPTLDDNPRENVPYSNYAFYRRLLSDVCEGTGKRIES